MGLKQVTKGKRFERKVRKWLNLLFPGLSAIFERTAASGALNLKGDICLKIHGRYYPLFECKSNLDPWSPEFRSVIDKCYEQKIPLLAFRFKQKTYIAGEHYNHLGKKQLYVCYGWTIFELGEEAKCLILSNPLLSDLLDTCQKISHKKERLNSQKC